MIMTRAVAATTHAMSPESGATSLAPPKRISAGKPPRSITFLRWLDGGQGLDDGEQDPHEEAGRRGGVPERSVRGQAQSMPHHGRTVTSRGRSRSGTELGTLPLLQERQEPEEHVLANP